MGADQIAFGMGYIKATYLAPDVERRRCLKPMCPDGRAWGICPEPDHWEQRQDYAKGSVSSTQPEITTAHLAHTAAYNLAHVITHLDQAMKTKDPKDRQFNLEHVHHHVGEVRDHLERLIDHFREHYPKEGKALDDLDDSIADTKCEGGDVASK